MSQKSVGGKIKGEITRGIIVNSSKNLCKRMDETWEVYIGKLADKVLLKQIGDLENKFKKYTIFLILPVWSSPVQYGMAD